MKKTIFEQTIVDGTSGEVLEKTWIRAQKLSSDTFIRTYIEDIATLAKCTKAELSVLLCCMKYIDYNTNELILNSSRRDEIAICSGLMPNTINIGLSRLYHKNILIKDAKKILLNPKLFFFGSDIERSKVLNLTLQYHLKQ